MGQKPANRYPYVRPPDIPVSFDLDRRSVEKVIPDEWRALERRTNSRRSDTERRTMARRSGIDRRSTERRRAEPGSDRRYRERRRSEGRRGTYLREKLTQFAIENRSLLAAKIPKEQVSATYTYECERRAPGTYRVHAYENGAYAGSYPVYRNEANSEFLCTCTTFLMSLPSASNGCQHTQRVLEFTRTPSSHPPNK